MRRCFHVFHLCWFVFQGDEQALLQKLGDLGGENPFLRTEGLGPRVEANEELRPPRDVCVACLLSSDLCCNINQAFRLLQDFFSPWKVTCMIVLLTLLAFRPRRVHLERFAGGLLHMS